MKKLLIFIILLSGLLVISGCDNEEQENEKCQTGETFKDGSCVIISDDDDQDDEEKIDDDKSSIQVTGNVELYLWHNLGKNELVLEEIVSEFEEKYSNIQVHLLNNGITSGEVRDKVEARIRIDGEPNLVIGDVVDYYDLYQNDDIVVLDDYLSNSNIVSKDSFFTGLTNNVVVDDKFIAIPYGMFSDIVVYNKTVFDAFDITVPTDGTLTWDMLNTYAETVVGDSANQCELLMSVDHTTRTFLNVLEQYGDGNHLDFFMDFRTFESDSVISTPLSFMQQYSNFVFVEERVCMVITPPGVINYIEKSNPSFELGVTLIPQVDTNNKQFLTSGTSVMMLDEKDENIKNASWLFMEFLLEDESMSYWAENTGYLPVTTQAYGSSSYQSFLSDTESSSEMYYHALANDLLLKQKDYFFSTEFTVGSSDFIGDYFEAYFLGHSDVTAFTDLLSDETDGLID